MTFSADTTELDVYQEDVYYSEVITEALLNSPLPEDLITSITDTIWREIPSEAFTAWAQCMGEDLSSFFDDKTDDEDPDAAFVARWTGYVSERAQVVCRACPVRHLCAQETLENPQNHVFGTMAGIRIPQSIKNSQATLRKLETEASRRDEARQRLHDQIVVIASALRKYDGDASVAWGTLQGNISPRVFLRACYLISNYAPSWKIRNVKMYC